MREIIVILHNVRSVHNVASIFRTADAAGISRIYLCGITPTPHDRFGRVRSDFAKVSLGAEHTVPWERVSTTRRAIMRAKKEGFHVVAVEQSSRSIPYPRVRKYKNNIALVMGNEVRGISPALLRNAGEIIEIPMNGKKESLNVSVAFGVVAYGVQY